MSLQEEIVADLTAELENEPTFSQNILEIKVKNAIQEVRLARNYAATNYTEEQIQSDLEQFYTVIKNIALFDFAQIGAPFETSHSENSTNRSWIDRNKLLGGVPAFVKVI